MLLINCKNVQLSLSLSPAVKELMCKAFADFLIKEGV